MEETESEQHKLENESAVLLKNKYFQLEEEGNHYWRALHRQMRFQEVGAVISSRRR